ncbi:MAG: STT3 domain-containing protein, partial [Deltaproteobacteria bacterium]|nr:STT3 domain-containing protein [Deltaproteobacteria bacterium]
SPLLDLSYAAMINALSWTAAHAAYYPAALPPVVGMLAVVPLFLWARECFGTSTALLASLIFAILPVNILSGMVGRPDNELIEPFWAALTFYMYALCNRERPQDSGDSGPLKDAALGVATGAVATLALLYWRGALLWWAIMAAHAVLSLLYRNLRKGGTNQRLWLSTTIAFAFAAALISLVNIIKPWGLTGGMRFNIVSWFHAVSAFIAAAGLFAAGLMAYLKEKRGLSTAASFALGAVLFLVLLVVTAAIAPDYFRGILQGTAVVGGENKWTSTIAQYRPLFKDASGRWSLAAPLESSRLLLFAAPLALIHLALRKRNDAASFFVFSGWALLLLTVINGRYENVLSIIVSISGAVLLGFVYRLMSREGQGASAKARGAAVTVAVLAGLLMPSLSFYRTLPLYSPFIVKGDLEESLLWIRDNTPATSHYYEPSRRPEYGVMARWEYGGWISAMARRPAIATIYGIETHGMKESAEMFLATDNEKFLRILDENHARYLILSKSIGALSGYAELLGRDPEGYLNERTDPSGRTILETGQKYFDLVHVNLYLADGQPSGGPVFFRGVGGVRLVYESATREGIGGLEQDVKKYKVFERVPGAAITGKARPNERVLLAGVVRTNRNRRFYAVSEAQAGPDGAFTLSAWYPSIGPYDRGVGVLGGYVLKAGDKERRVFVTEDDVVSGRELK